jgi:hypothetical protein
MIKHIFTVISYDDNLITFEVVGTYSAFHWIKKEYADKIIWSNDDYFPTWLKKQEEEQGKLDVYMDFKQKHIYFGYHRDTGEYLYQVVRTTLNVPKYPRNQEPVLRTNDES